MDHDRIDLTPIGFGADDDRTDRMLAAIMRMARPELERRGAGAEIDVLDVLAQWVRPALAAAAVLAIASSLILTRGVTRDAETVSGPAVAAAEAVLPAHVATWLDEGRAPATTDVVAMLEDRP